MRILIERSAGWNDQLWVLTVDLSNVWGSVGYEEVLRRALQKRIGAQGALDILRTVTGLTMFPEWINISGQGCSNSSRVPTRRSGIANLVESRFGRGP